MVTISSFEEQKTLYGGIHKNPLKTINYFNYLYKSLIKIFKGCIRRMPMGNLVNTEIKLFRLDFYDITHFFSDIRRHGGYSHHTFKVDLSYNFEVR